MQLGTSTLRPIVDEYSWTVISPCAYELGPERLEAIKRAVQTCYDVAGERLAGGSMNHNERDLLFGVLAIQVDLLSQEQLIAARVEWVGKQQESLGEILLRQLAITQNQKDALDALVDVHLEAHGDGEKSLSVASQTKDGVLSSFRRMPVDEADESITHTGDDMPTLAAGKIGGSGGTTGPTSGQGSRYRLLRLHEEGGLGRVYLAHDDELDRTVALKEIKETLADDVTSQSRFILEAEITGGLEHPGIVPVYGFGRYNDERPFYAMRFIRGGSLRQAIRDYHADLNRGDDPLPLRRLLRRFVDVCNVMTYSHRRGVLHRDLKPNNVMLGQHGETLVVDWGLAKTLGDEDPESKVDVSDRSAPHSALVPRSGSTFDDTVLGKAIGSPPYMSPEQARGEHNQLGPSTDIYSLGGILYSILTNRAPVEADTLVEVLEKVRDGEIDAPSDVASDVPKPLESVAMKALSMEPEHRYDSVQALIQDVENYLADEPVSAHSESVGEKFSRVSRRHRSLVRSAAAALLAITAISIAAVFSLNHQRKMTQREKIRGDLVLEQMVNTFSSADPEVDGRTIKVVDVLDRAVADAEKLNNEPLAKASILHAIGRTYDGLGLHKESLPPLEVALEIRQEHLGASHIATLQSEFEVASAQLGMRDTEESISRFREIVKQRERVLGPNHSETFAARNSLAYANVVANKPKEAIEIYESSMKTFRSGKERWKDHSGIVSLMTGLAYAYNVDGQSENADRQIDESVAYAQSKLGDQNSLTLAAKHLKAEIVRNSGRIKEAISLFEPIYESRMRSLGESHGDTTSTANDLAVLYFQDGRHEDATDLLENVCRQRAAKFGDAHILTTTARWNLAIIYSRIDKAPKAAATLQLIADTLTEQHSAQECVKILNSLVIAYELARDRVGAKSAYLQMAETNGIGDDVLVRALRGVAHHSLAQQQHEDAYSAATRWVGMLETDDQLRSLICLADSQLGLGEVDAADKTLTKVTILLGDERPEYVEHLQAIVMAEQGDFAGAEPILRRTYPVIMSSELTIKVSYRRAAARRRIDAFYEKWGKSEKTAEWRTERDELAE